MLRFSLFLAGVMMVGTSIAGGASTCPADTIPIQITDEMKRRHNPGPVTTLSAADMSDTDPHFHDFVTAVTTHVAAKLAKEKSCVDGTLGKEQSLLHFVHWPLVISDKKSLAVPSIEAQPAGGCRITSPWIDIAFERKSVPWVRAVVRWNERQLLADQAVLDGSRNAPPGVVMPLKKREFDHFAVSEYAASEILRQPASTRIEERVPPDLLWLFRRATQSTRAPFSGFARNAMKNAMRTSAEYQTKLVIALIDRCFSSDGAEIHYNNILDTKDLIALDQYKITVPIR
jgi:hypothetical protein